MNAVVVEAMTFGENADVEAAANNVDCLADCLAARFTTASDEPPNQIGMGRCTGRGSGSIGGTSQIGSVSASPSRFLPL